MSKAGLTRSWDAGTKRFPLKRVIWRVIPTRFGPHLDLAVDCVELGQVKAARAEVADILRINPQFTLKMGVEGEFPAQRERAADLRKAGLK
jgi:hypothetical protein